MWRRDLYGHYGKWRLRSRCVRQTGELHWKTLRLTGKKKKWLLYFCNSVIIRANTCEWQWLNESLWYWRSGGDSRPAVNEHFIRRWSWNDEVPLSGWMEKGRIVRLQENWVWVLMSLVLSHLCFPARFRWAVLRNLVCEITAEQQI